MTSTPVGAEVYLNHSKSASGRTPLTLSDIDAATANYIEVRKSGFRPAHRTVDWTEKTKQEVPFLLKP